MIKKTLSVPRGIAVSIAVFALASSTPVLSQSSTELISIRVQPDTPEGCGAFVIAIDVSLGYFSGGSALNSAQTSIQLRSLASALPADSAPTELIGFFTKNVPVKPSLGGISVTLAPAGNVPVLLLSFDGPVYSRASDAGPGLIAVQVATQNAPESCRAVFNAPASALPEPGDGGQAADAGPDAALASVDADTGATGRDLVPLSLDSQAAVEVAYTAARAAITSGDNRSAISQLNKILSFPENNRSASARELLGVVRERNGQLAHARAEYETYLERYPDSEGATRVKQRLAALNTAEAEPPKPLRPARADQGRLAAEEIDPRKAPFDNVRVERPSGRKSPRLPSPEPEEEQYPIIESWGSLEATYYFNQGTTVLEEFETDRVDKDDFIFENSLVTSLDYFWSREDADTRIEYRFSGSYVSDFTDGYEDEVHLSRVYGEYQLKDPGLTFRFGRQTLYTSGVFGRFDGLRTSWQPNERAKYSFQIGSAVDSVRDAVFTFDRPMFGVNVDLYGALPNTDINVYAFHQRADSYTDRSAVGAEFIYRNDNRTMAGIFDYDVYFNQVNLARFTGTQVFPDRSTLTVSADYVLSPYLTLSNALQGQTVTTLDQLLTIYTLDEVEQLALDRTTETASLTLNYYKPLNDKWQASADATVFYTGGNPASGGVPEVVAPGVDVFFSTGLYGYGIFDETDVISSSFRYANTSSSDLYLIDGYYRFWARENLRLRSRLKLGYRDLKTSGGQEVFAIPSITAEYEIADAVTLDLEVGDNFSITRLPGSKERSNDVYLFFGVRRDF